MNKKDIESQIANLISDYQKETDLKVSFINISKEESIGFKTETKIKAEIKIK